MLRAHLPRANRPLRFPRLLHRIRTLPLRIAERQGLPAERLEAAIEAFVAALEHVRNKAALARVAAGGDFNN